MSTLTNKEREGLEDVFLSIHANTAKYQKIKEISSLIVNHETSFNFTKLLKHAKCGLKETKLSYLLLSFSKKKKNLSK